MCAASTQDTLALDEYCSSNTHGHPRNPSGRTVEDETQWHEQSPQRTMVRTVPTLWTAGSQHAKSYLAEHHKVVQEACGRCFQSG